MSTEEDRVFIIAEAGVNHNGSESMARELVYSAAEAGADAVKFQTFSAEKLVLKNASKADYQIENTRTNDSQYEMLKALELTVESQIVLRELCDSLNIEFMSSPFDPDSVDFLAHTVGVKRLKIPSGEVINGLMLLRAARTRLPLILSSGMCTLEEVLNSLALLVWAGRNKTGIPSSHIELELIRKEKNWSRPLQKHVWLMQCVTQYPAPPQATNLHVMNIFREHTNLTIGLSDHSQGWHIALAAIAAGARVIEKHFTLSRRLPGPDHIASLEPDEFARMVREIRDIETAFGSNVKEPNEVELKNRVAARGSLVAQTDISIGQKFSMENLSIKRPGTGLSPVFIWDLIGKTAVYNYKKDEQINKNELTD